MIRRHPRSTLFPTRPPFRSMQHCEEPSLSGGSMHAGLVSTTLGLGGIPAEAEQLMIARDLLLNRTIGCRYHVQHISTAGSVEDRKSTRLNSSHANISYAVFC